MEQIQTLKEQIISKIRNSNDFEYLLHIQEMIVKNEEKYVLSQEQERSIEISRQQIESGQYSSHKDVMNRTRKWIQERK